jgi:Uma2 family endonuclease
MGAVERVRPRVSFADLERAPEDGRRYELYDGEVYVVPAPMPRHQVVQHKVVEALRALSRQRDGFAVGSPIDIVFSQYDVLQPDVSFSGPRGRTWSISIARFATPPTCASRSCHRPPRRPTVDGSSRCSPATACPSTGSWTRPRT